MLNISENALVHYLKGRRPINAEIIAKIAELCDASVKWILLGDDETEGWLQPSKKIGAHIKNIRINNNLTQADMAKSLGISLRMLSDIEQGIIEPSRNVLLRIVDQFDIDINSLMTDDKRREGDTKRDERQNARRILDRLKSAFGLKTDAKLADFLGVKPSTVATWIIRNSVNYELIIASCKGKIDLNWLLAGDQESQENVSPPDTGEEDSRFEDEEGKKSQAHPDTTQVARLQKEVEELKAQIKVLKELIITLKSQ